MRSEQACLEPHTCPNSRVISTSSHFPSFSSFNEKLKNHVNMYRDLDLKELYPRSLVIGKINFKGKTTVWFISQNEVDD